MPSNYTSFAVLIDNLDGNPVPVPTQTVEIFNATTGASLGSTASDAAGTVPGAAVAVAAGTRLRFEVDLGDGRAGYAEAVTS